MNYESNFIQGKPTWEDSTEAPNRPLKIVCVEDCPFLLKLKKSFIQDAFKHAEILTFSDGSAAWTQLEGESPDLLISDFVHPGMNGFEMLQRLSRKNVSYPIVINSGQLPEKELRARHCAGPRLKVRYVPKPFIDEHFIALLEQCLNPICPDKSSIRRISSMNRLVKVYQLDDEKSIFRYVSALLQRCFKNMQLFQFKNSPTAWRILTQAEPGLFITGDIMHPDPQWNGQNIVRRLLERKVEYPIILMSGWPRTLECMSKVQAEYRKFSLLPEPFTPAQFYRELGRFFSLRNLP